MDVDEIRKLIRLMEEAGLTELEIEDRSGKVRLVRGARRRAGRAADATTVQVGSGLNPGDIVVTAGVQALRPGQKVRLLETQS
mgnify:CR=1 FL=1